MKLILINHKLADGYREKGAFTLNSDRPVSGAGSCIVARPDRVRRGERGEGQGVHGQRLPLGSWGSTPVGVELGGGYWQIFMGCRCSICRCLIELCDVELVSPPDLHQDNPWWWLRGQRRSPGQNEQPAADGPEDV